MTRRLALAALLILLGAAQPVVAASCSAYASTIVFGTYSQGTAINVTGTITVTCTSGTTYHVSLNAGLGNGATITNRLMSGGTGGNNTMSYGMFSNAARTLNWGNSSGTGWVAGTGTGRAQAITVYAQVPATDFGALGSFSDTITASITGSFTTASATFGASVNVVAGCGISATSMVFPNYSGLAVQSTSTLTVTCTGTTPYNVGLNQGTATGATVTNRSMTGPASVLLGYKLFSNSGRTTNWGNTVGTSTVAGTGTGVAQALTVYGQILAGLSVQPGSYADTITATITY
jgi:spore coat protein U-like protein